MYGLWSRTRKLYLYLYHNMSHSKVKSTTWLNIYFIYNNHSCNHIFMPAGERMIILFFPFFFFQIILRLLQCCSAPFYVSSLYEHMENLEMYEYSAGKRSVRMLYRMFRLNGAKTPSCMRKMEDFVDLVHVYMYEIYVYPHLSNGWKFVFWKFMSWKFPGTIISQDQYDIFVSFYTLIVHVGVWALVSYGITTVQLCSNQYQDIDDTVSWYVRHM